MSFRTLVPLLCISTAVIAQVPISNPPAPPSPSLPESVNLQPLPSTTQEKPIAPRPVNKPRRNGLRLAASLSTVDSDLQNPARPAAITIVNTQSQPNSRSAPIVSPAPIFPRTASLGSHSRVPTPRPLPGVLPGALKDVGVDLSRLDRLNRELRRKQHQLTEIQAEISQLSLDIAAAEPTQVLVEMTLYEVINDNADPLFQLLAPSATQESQHNTLPETSNSVVVMSAESGNVLNALANSQLQNAQLLKTLSRPRIITRNGRQAEIEVSSNEFSLKATVTPQLDDSEWKIDTRWQIRHGESLHDYSATTRFTDGNVAAFRISANRQTFVGVMNVKAVEPDESPNPSDSATKSVTPVSFKPLLPIPDPENNEHIKVIRNVDINLKKTSATWRNVF